MVPSVHISYLFHTHALPKCRSTWGFLVIPEVQCSFQDLSGFYVKYLQRPSFREMSPYSTAYSDFLETWGNVRPERQDPAAPVNLIAKISFTSPIYDWSVNDFNLITKGICGCLEEILMEDWDEFTKLSWIYQDISSYLTTAQIAWHQNRYLNSPKMLNASKKLRISLNNEHIGTKCRSSKRWRSRKKLWQRHVWMGQNLSEEFVHEDLIFKGNTYMYIVVVM